MEQRYLGIPLKSRLCFLLREVSERLINLKKLWSLMHAQQKILSVHYLQSLPMSRYKH